MRWISSRVYLKSSSPHSILEPGFVSAVKCAIAVALRSLSSRSHLLPMTFAVVVVWSLSSPPLFFFGVLFVTVPSAETVKRFLGGDDSVVAVVVLAVGPVPTWPLPSSSPAAAARALNAFSNSRLPAISFVSSSLQPPPTPPPPPPLPPPPSSCALFIPRSINSAVISAEPA